MLLIVSIPDKIFGTKSRNTSKLDKTTNTLISSFACFLTVLLLSKFNFWKEEWALGYARIKIWQFPNIS